MTTPKRVPRGIRNNNPGNIEFNEANPWSGSAGHDGRFIKFKERLNLLNKGLENHHLRFLFAFLIRVL